MLGQTAQREDDNRRVIEDAREIGPGELDRSHLQFWRADLKREINRQPALQIRVGIDEELPEQSAFDPEKRQR